MLRRLKGSVLKVEFLCFEKKFYTQRYKSGLFMYQYFIIFEGFC